MTFPTIRLPFLILKKEVSAPAQDIYTDDQSDFRREYIERLVAADACVGEFGVQALMSFYPKDF